MKFSRRTIPLGFALGAAALLPLRALADDRLAGYWVPAPGETAAATFSFGILGRWTIVSAHWDGFAPDLKVRYTVVTTGATGTFTADEKLDRLPDAPHSMSYEIKGGELFLSIPDTAHVGKYHMVKGEPPASVPAPAPSASDGPPAAPPHPPRTTRAPAHDANALLGKWTSEPGASVQIALFISASGPTSVKINQQWAKEGEASVTSRAGEYAADISGDHGTLTKAEAEYEGSPIPLHLDYTFSGDALVITAGDGVFAGQYRLVRKQK